MSRRRVVFVGLLTVYVALSVAVVAGSPLDRVDRWIRTLPIDRQAPGWHHFVLDYVMLGQRGPSTAVAIVWIAWLCRSRRSLNPLVMFGTALLLLNASVGVVKYAIGRRGPAVTPHAHDVLVGGDIFPSGHVSNAVVLFGVLAMLAAGHRRAMVVLAVWVSFSVGISTLYLDTHWLTDVVGGWLAGGLVLLVVPRATRMVEDRLDQAWKAARARRAASGRPQLTPPPAPRQKRIVISDAAPFPDDAAVRLALMDPAPSG